MKAIAIQVITTHDGDLCAFRDGVVRTEVGRRQFHLSHLARSAVRNHYMHCPRKLRLASPAMLSLQKISSSFQGIFFFGFYSPSLAPIE
jgi:hypothetical protein